MVKCTVHATIFFFLVDLAIKLSFVQITRQDFMQPIVKTIVDRDMVCSIFLFTLGQIKKIGWFWLHPEKKQGRQVGFFILFYFFIFSRNCLLTCPIYIFYYKRMYKLQAISKLNIKPVFLTIIIFKSFGKYLYENIIVQMVGLLNT